MHSTLISKKYEIYIILKVKDYTIPVVYKNSLTDFNSVSKVTLYLYKSKKRHNKYHMFNE